jgi:acetoin utilization protein AcuB
MTTSFSPDSLRVGDLMTQIPATVDEDLSLADATERMFHNEIRHLVVTRGNREVVGVVSQRDLALATSLSSDGKVAHAMTRHPYSCRPGSPLLDVVTEMEQGRYGCAIVMHDGLPAGVFTTTDALRAVRSLLTGQLQEPLRPSTHIVDQPAERERVDHLTRANTGVSGARPFGQQKIR